MSPRVVHALVAAREAGYVLSIASGRPFCSVNKQVLACGAMSYAVCSNGASVVRVADGAPVSQSMLSREDALRCHEMLAPFKPAWNAFFGGHAYFEWKGASYMLTGRTGAVARAMRAEGASSGLLTRLARFGRKGMLYVWRMATNRSHKQVRSVLPHVRRAAGGVEKMGCTIPNPQLCAQAAELLCADGSYEVVHMGATELEITARGVSKASGAQALMQLLDIGPQKATAFGDGGNDMPLAAVCGRFVAVGNADEEVKAIATEVCGSVAEDGVAVWIENMLARDGQKGGLS